MTLVTYQLAATVQYARSELDSNFNFVNLFCILCAACGVGEVLTLLVISVLTRGVLEDHCRPLRCLTAWFITMSRCGCHFVFHSRCKTLNRNDVAVEKLSISLYFIVGISCCQTAHATVVAFTMTHDACVELQLPLVNKAMFVVFFVVILLLQMIIMALIIRPIYLHVNRESSVESGSRVRNVLVRTSICTACFVVSDLIVLVERLLRLFESVPGEFFVSASLIINTTALQCSFSNSKQRLFPFFFKPEVNEAPVAMIAAKVSNMMSKRAVFAVGDLPM